MSTLLPPFDVITYGTYGTYGTYSTYGTYVSYFMDENKAFKLCMIHAALSDEKLRKAV
jgi:hypothetical protein